MMSSILKMIAVLGVLCGFSGFILSYLKAVTAPAVEEQILNNVQGPAISDVFVQADNNPVADRRVFDLPGGGKVTVFPCFRAGRLIGVALENSGKGYGGSVGVMVGFNIAGDTLAGVGMTALKETPGLGMRVREPAFTEQFRSLALPAALSSAGGRIDAVSGATVSSGGVIEAVNRAGEAYRTLKPEFFRAWKQTGE